MLQTLVKLSLEFRHLVLAAALLLVAAGAVLLPKAKTDALPEFGAPVVEVQTEALGLSTGEVESLVTINLEEILTATPFLKSIHSKSVPGMASVLLTFEPDMDPMKARQMVQERLTMAWALPNVSKPPTMLQPKSAAGRAMIVGLSSKTVSLIDMSVLARWTMTPKLLSVPGVANVAIWGQRARQLQVQIEPQRLESAGVSLDEAVESAGDSLWVSPLSYLEASVLGSGGWIDTPNQRLGIQHVQPISKASDLTKVAVPSSALRLGDVAEVVEGHPPLIGDAMINGQPGLILVVEKLPNVDTKAVVAGVEAALAELSQGMPGIDIDASLYRASDYVDSALANLVRMVIAAMVVVSVALFLSLTPVGTASVAVVAIVLSYVAALVALYFSSPIFNLIHLAGLAAALSLVVDTAVVAAEALGRRLRAGGGASIRCDRRNRQANDLCSGDRSAGGRSDTRTRRRNRGILPAAGSGLWRHGGRCHGRRALGGARPRDGFFPFGQRSRKQVRTCGGAAVRCGLWAAAGEVLGDDRSCLCDRGSRSVGATRGDARPEVVAVAVL
ncbi:MAG: efflux RND transporter permease subunit [Mesorhizobium sp.]|nr:MAG: efflux RND transporter permease subunit [Mesorhizobium sp.]